MSGDVITAVSQNLQYRSEESGPLRLQRIGRIARLIASHDPQICLLQECLPGDLEEILRVLPHSSGTFFRRTQVEKDREGLAVIWCEPLEFHKQERIWFSPTPELESLAWRAAHYRIGIFTTFSLKGRQLAVANVHFDHRSRLSRARSAHLLASRLQSSTAAGVIVGGDFNASKRSFACRLLEGLALDNLSSGASMLHRSTDASGHFAKQATFLGLRGIPWTKRVLDHFFHGGALQCQSFALQDPYADNLWLSDHRMLIARYQTQR